MRRLATQLLICGTMLIPLPALTAQYVGIVPLYQGGDPTRVLNFIFVPDGFPNAQELSTYTGFYVPVDSAFRSISPFNEYNTYYNIYRMDIYSSLGEPLPPEALAAIPGPSYLFIYVPKSAGPGGVLGLSTLCSSSTLYYTDRYVTAHEIGHSLGCLGDEYGSSPSLPCGAADTNVVNLSLDPNPNTVKWHVWNGIEGTSVFQGGGYCDTGIYRSSSDSIMRTIPGTFNAVSREALIKKLNLHIRPIPSPTTMSQPNLPPGLVQFSYTPPTGTHPAGASDFVYKWYLEPVPMFLTSLSGATTSSFSLDTSLLPPSNQPMFLSVKAFDPDINQWVRNGVAETAGFTWIVSADFKPTISGYWRDNANPSPFVFLFGSNFMADATQVTVNGVGASVQVVDPGMLLFIVPAGVTSGPIMATTPLGSATSPIDYGTVLTGLNVTGISPIKGPAGTFVFVFGSGFVSNATQVSITQNNIVIANALAQVVDEGLLIFILPDLPENVSAVKVKITTPAGTANSPMQFIVAH